MNLHQGERNRKDEERRKREEEERQKKEEEQKNIDLLLKDIENQEKIKIGTKLGSGGYGSIYKVTMDGRNYVGKLMKNNKYETEFASTFKGRYLSDTIKIFKKKKSGENYCFLIMKEANLSDLKHVKYDIDYNLKFNLIINFPFEGILPDNLLKFYSYQIIRGLESLERANYFHFDIKPQNILIFKELISKISDFGLLRHLDKVIIKDSQDCMIPGGTNGFLSPEFYQYNGIVPFETVKRQDCFALGATLYSLKYGKDIIEYFKHSDDDLIKTTDFIIDSIQRARDNIKSKKYLDKDFIDFLSMLINYKPEERQLFKEMIGNKWLNKDIKEILEIHSKNCIDDSKDIFELAKSDFLIKKQKEREGRIRKKFTFKKYKKKK